MKLATHILDIINEMAAPYRSQFIPGQYKVYAAPNGANEWGSYDSFTDKLVFGRLSGEGVKDKIGVQTVKTYSIFQNFGKEAIEYLDKEYSMNLIGYLEYSEIDEFFLEVLEKTLKKNGWKDITNRENMARDTNNPVHNGKSEYATGWKREQTVEKYVGKVYHGTPDKNFINLRHDSEGFGKGSHLKSLNGGDALSITPNIKIAEEFMDGRGGMIVEFDANLTVYYASRIEDDLDEIEYPPECDAVAIPFGRYEEDEFAVIRRDNDDTIHAVAVYLYVRGKLKRYPINEDKVIWQGPMMGFLLNWIRECFKSKELRDALVKVEHDIDLNPNGMGASFCINLGGVRYYIDCERNEIWDEENMNIFPDEFIALINEGTE